MKAFGFVPINEVTIVKRIVKPANKATYRSASAENCAPSCDSVDHLAGATAIQEMLEPDKYIA